MFAVTSLDPDAEHKIWKISGHHYTDNTSMLRK